MGYMIWMLIILSLKTFFVQGLFDFMCEKLFKGPWVSTFALGGVSALITMLTLIVLSIEYPIALLGTLVLGAGVFDFLVFFVATFISSYASLRFRSHTVVAAAFALQQLIFVLGNIVLTTYILGWMKNSGYSIP